MAKSRNNRYFVLFLTQFLMFYLPNLLWALCNGENAAEQHPLAALAYATVLTGPFFAAAVLMIRFLPVRVSSAVVVLLSALHCLLVTVGIGHYLTYGHGISPSTFYIALNSNVSEAMNYARMYVGPSVLLAIASLYLFWALLGLLFLKTARTCAPLRWKVVGYLALPGILAGNLFVIVPPRYKMLDSYLDAYRSYTSDQGKMNLMRQKNRAAGKGIAAARTASIARKETYVLVIGESASRSHMGLYGYFRDTTPYLSSLKDELFVYKDVLSADFCTFLSIRKMLTFANYQDMSPLYGPNLVQIMKGAGFKTYWISNQKSNGTGDLWGKYFSEAADERVYLNNSYLSDPMDEVLVPPFVRILQEKDDKKFIVLHMMGSHLHAGNRYPAAFRHFSTTRNQKAYFARSSAKTKEYINHYDNSILYTDSVLYRLVSNLRGAEGAKMFLFLSDHSDQLGEVDDFVGRSYRTNHYQFEIPFLVWLSPEYRERRKDFVQHLKEYADRRYQADDLIHSYLDLAAVSASSYDPQRSIFSAAFKEKNRHMEIPLSPIVDLLPNVAEKSADGSSK